MLGVIWYQGESNIGNGIQYPCLQSEMIKAWRLLFDCNFAFIYVQISTWSL